jgi:hypothetical protein
VAVRSEAFRSRLGALVGRNDVGLRRAPWATVDIDARRIDELRDSTRPAGRNRLARKTSPACHEIEVALVGLLS